MKKTLALIASVAMLALCTGCGSTKNTEATTTAATTASETTASEAAEAETTAAETTAAAEEAETTASETEAQSEAEEITEEDVDISNIVNADELQAVLDSRADGLWAVDIGNKISEWPNNVVITLEYEDEEDMSVIAKVHTLGDRFRMYTAIPGFFTMDIMFDGTNAYMIDEASSTYCKDNESYDASAIEDAETNLLAGASYDTYVGSGIEEIYGVPYIYEEFNSDGETIKIYYNASGEICYAGSPVEDGMMYMDYSIEFFDEPDESYFQIPDGYTEITSDEYAAKMLAGLFPEE